MILLSGKAGSLAVSPALCLKVRETSPPLWNWLLFNLLQTFIRRLLFTRGADIRDTSKLIPREKSIPIVDFITKWNGRWKDQIDDTVRNRVSRSILASSNKTSVINVYNSMLFHRADDSRRHWITHCRLTKYGVCGDSSEGWRALWWSFWYLESGGEKSMCVHIKCKHKHTHTHRRHLG